MTPLENNAEFQRMFDYHLIKMKQAGLMTKIADHYIPDPPLIVGMSEASQLGYNNLLFPIIVLSFGISSAIIMVIIEKLGRCLRAKRAACSRISFG